MEDKEHMREITLEELLEAGCHFGHQVTRSNPKARDFIYEVRDNIHIIDLAKTKKGIEEAVAFIRTAASQNKILVIVGTKRQAQGIVDSEIKKAREKIKDKEGNNAGIFFVTNRWVGGTLTNFAEVSKNFKKLKELEEKLGSEEEKSKYTKKEVGLWFKEKQKLESLYGGISDLKRKPDVLFIIDSHLENLAVKEATDMGVATVAVVDTNADPELVDYPIPANDDATGSIKLITSYITDAWIEGAGDKIKNDLSVDKTGNQGSKEKKPAKAKESKTEKARELKSQWSKGSGKDKSTKNKK